MREIISNKDIGSTINFRTVGPYEARHPWPAETVVSAGKGAVFVRNPKEGEPHSYTTLFMEVYPPGAAFIRGQAETPEGCENACWRKYQLALNCSDNSGSHDWEPRGYQNGAGFCSRCNTFGSEVFTGEQLGQFCATCQEPTMWHSEKNAEGELIFVCEEHTPARAGWPFADDDEDEEPVEVNEENLKAAIGNILTALAGDPDKPETKH